jgi:hypothetical protein
MTHTQEAQLQEHLVPSEGRTAAVRLARCGAGERRSPGPDHDLATEPRRTNDQQRFGSRYPSDWEDGTVSSWHHLPRLELPVLSAVARTNGALQTRWIDGRWTV